VKLEVALSELVTWIAGGDGSTPDDATLEDAEEVCVRSGCHGLTTLSCAGRTGIGG
jgi:hypothetical protein